MIYEEDREKANRLLEKYGDVKLRFHSYYKYQFHFLGIYESVGIYLVVHGDGDPNRIYNFNIIGQRVYHLRELFPEWYCSISVNTVPVWHFEEGPTDKFDQVMGDAPRGFVHVELPSGVRADIYMGEDLGGRPIARPVEAMEDDEALVMVYRKKLWRQGES